MTSESSFDEALLLMKHPESTGLRDVFIIRYCQGTLTASSVIRPSPGPLLYTSLSW